MKITLSLLKLRYLKHLGKALSEVNHEMMGLGRRTVPNSNGKFMKPTFFCQMI